MTFLGKAGAILALAVLAGCAGSGDRFGDGSGSGASAGGAGALGGGLGSVDDPTSPAFFQASVGDRVFFAVDQSTLSPEATATLNAQAEWLLTNSEYTAVIEGHADERGTTEYNIALGARRANAVQEFLFSRGIPISRMQVVSFGKERPVEICSDEVCYAQNRRSVTVLSIGAGF